MLIEWQKALSQEIKYLRRRLPQSCRNEPYQKLWMCVSYIFMALETNALYRSLYTGLFQMIVGVLTTCHTQYTWDRSIWIFYLIEQHSKFLLHTLQVLYMCILCDSTNINTIICIYIYIYTGLFEMIVGVSTNYNTHYTWDRSMYFFI